MQKKTYDVIFFDAGGTLLHPYPSVGAVYAEVGKRYGIDQHPTEIEAAFRTVWQKMQEEREQKTLRYGVSEEESKIWWKTVVERVFRTIGIEQNISAYFEEVYQVFAEPRCWRLFPEVLEVLDFLGKNDYPLGIISNWDTRLPHILEGLGISPYFRYMVISSKVGAEKPDPRIFEAALRLAQVSPERALLVGDSAIDDVVGAERVGMHGVLLDRRDTTSSNRRTVKDLRGLFQFL